MFGKISCKTCSSSSETKYARVLKCHGLATIRRENGIEVSEAEKIHNIGQPHLHALVREDFYCKFYYEAPPSKETPHENR